MCSHVRTHFTPEKDTIPSIFKLQESGFHRTPQKTGTLSPEHKTRRLVLNSHSERRKPQVTRGPSTCQSLCMHIFFFFKHVRHGHPYSSEIGHTRDRTQLAPCLVLQIQLSGEIDELRENSLEVIPLLPNAAQDVARTFRREIAIIEVR